MIIGFVRGFLATAAIVWCSATAALAAVDMNGAWFLSGSKPGMTAFCRLDSLQTPSASKLMLWAAARRVDAVSTRDEVQ